MEFLKKGVIVVLSIFLCIAGLSPKVFAASEGMMNRASLSGVNVKLGITSTLPNTNEESGVGFVLGISSDKIVFPVLSNVVLQPEVLIVKKKVNYYDDDSNSMDELSATYLEFPLLCKASIEISQCTFSFYMGPYLGLKMTDTIPNYLKNYAEIQSTTIGITVGESVTVQNLSFEVRYDEGLTSYIEGKNSYSNNENKNHTWMFMVGYQF